MALLNVPVTEISRAATWTSVHTFSNYCALVHASRVESAVGNAVLSSALDSIPKITSPYRNTALESPSEEQT